MSRKHTKAPEARQDSALPKYSIAVASDLSGVPQQQLRRMEENGLVSPGRTEGNTRRYSDDDLQQIAQVAELTTEGMNMIGIRHVLELRAEVNALRREVEELRQRLAAHTPTPD